MMAASRFPVKCSGQCTCLVAGHVAVQVCALSAYIETHWLDPFSLALEQASGRTRVQAVGLTCWLRMVGRGRVSCAGHAAVSVILPIVHKRCNNYALRAIE